jgi:hypothetical protein
MVTRGLQGWGVRVGFRCSRQTAGTAGTAAGTAAGAAEEQQNIAVAMGSRRRRGRSGGTGPSGAGSRRRRKDGGKDAAGEADGGKRSPELEREHLTEGGSTARRVGRRVKERDGTKKADSGVKQGEDIGPGNIG